MSACISQHGEFSDHEPGDYCPLCGEFNTAAVIHERDTAAKDRDDWQDEAQRLGNTLDSIRELLETETDERGITWWEWIDGGLGGDLHARLRSLLDPPGEKQQACRECRETKHSACDGSALVDDGMNILSVDCLCASGGHA